MPVVKRNDSKFQVYLDTCILQGAISQQNNADIIFLDTLKKKKVKVYSSIHTLMELMDIEKDRTFLIKKVFDEHKAVNSFLRGRAEKDLNQSELGKAVNKVNNFLFTNKQITFGNITEDVWNDVKSIVENSNIHSSDALHLALAIMWQCQFLVTHDQFFITEGNRILKESDNTKIIVCDIAVVNRAIEKQVTL